MNKIEKAPHGTPVKILIEDFPDRIAIEINGSIPRIGASIAVAMTHPLVKHSVIAACAAYFSETDKVLANRLLHKSRSTMYDMQNITGEQNCFSPKPDADICGS